MKWLIATEQAKNFQQRAQELGMEPELVDRGDGTTEFFISHDVYYGVYKQLCMIMKPIGKNSENVGSNERKMNQVTSM